MLRGIRHLSSSLRCLARGIDIGPEQIKKPNTSKPTRQERIDITNMTMQSKLFKLDNKFKIFNKNVTKVVDLGYVPGNWMSYSKFRLCLIHGLEEEKFTEKCHILGFDLLFGSPPQGVSAYQGNIYSKMAHRNIVNHLKEIALRERKNRIREQKAIPDPPHRFKSSQTNSYYVKEQSETLIESQLQKIGENLDDLKLDSEKLQKFNELKNEKLHKKTQNLSLENESTDSLDYKCHVVLSDLSKPFIQQYGFFNQTHTRPYLRMGANDSLNKPYTDPLKATFDLADAALLLTCLVLRQDGTFVLRLSRIDLADPELSILQNRLERVFAEVVRWSNDGIVSSKEEKILELFFICREKRTDEEANVREIFSD